MIICLCRHYRPGVEGGSGSDYGEMTMPNRNAALFRRLAVFFAALFAWTAAAAAGTVDRTVLLVANPEFSHPVYSSAVLLAMPLPEGGYVGFMINKPTTAKLAEMFPEHEPSKKIADPVYLGGPAGANALFALVQRHGKLKDRTVQLTPELFLATEAKDVDKVIESEADRARFFMGLMLWEPGRLSEELDAGYWSVIEPDVKLVMRKNTQGMWEELTRRVNERESGI
jgi:putative transcriptional regulator